MENWLLIVCILAAALLVYLLVKEYQRANRRHLAARLIASATAISSLTLIAIPITFKTPGSGRTAILITDGFNIDSLTRFQKKYDVAVPMYSAGTKYHDDRALTTIHSASLRDTLLNFDSVHVFGYGLPDDKLVLFENLPFHFHPSPQPNGFTTVDWTRSLRSGENFQVQGKVHYDGTDELTVVLSSSGEKLDSAVVRDGVSEFILNDRPRQVGRTTYQLNLIRINDTVEKVTIPFEVSSPQPFSILALSSSPDFETRFLKNWLTANQFEYAQRTRISTGKYDQQFINRKPLSLLRITPSLLDQFTIVISDAEALQALTSTEQSTIRKQIREKGLGLVLRTSTTTTRKTGFLQPFSFKQTSSPQSKSLQLRSTASSTMFTPLLVDQPVFISETPNLKSIIFAGTVGNTAAASLDGKGKIVATTVNNSYHWILGGHTADYHEYWSRILSEALPGDFNKILWRFEPSVPTVNQPVRIIIEPSEDSIPLLNTNNILLPVQQGITMREQWSTIWWPFDKGWQQVTNRFAENKWIYIHDSDEWLPSKAFRRLNKMKRVAGFSKQNATNNRDVLVPKAVPPIYFFIMFVISAGYLWLEKKLVMSS